MSSNLIEAAIAAARSRSSWNRWLEHAEKPASDHEEQKIERAARLASQIVNNNTWISLQNVAVRPQGSYFNNTNVRLEADMDLRVELPDVKVIYQNDLQPKDVSHIMTFSDAGRTYDEFNTQIRNQLVADLSKLFGAKSVDATGEKAIKVHGLDGSRSDCDLVPTFKLNVFQQTVYGPRMLEGVAIRDRSGFGWTYNFPQQHHENGKEKRRRTSLRFKRIVRMLKGLNYELEALGMIKRRIPSFYVECLVYLIEDEFFLFDADDRYDRLVRILNRLVDKLCDDVWCNDATEVNEIKYLFRENPAWTSLEALTFVLAGLERLKAER